jgi:hypothetical protein
MSFLYTKGIKQIISTKKFEDIGTSIFAIGQDRCAIGSRIGQILHTKLRLECSNLKLHLCLRNLCSSPLCSCGKTESIHHFLLVCKNYSQECDCTILTIQHTISLDLLLYGSVELIQSENEEIFLTVQKFILNSKRFS